MLGGRGGSDIGRGVSISSGISSSTASGLVVISNVDFDSGDNDGNASDVAVIGDIDDGDDSGEDNAPNTDSCHNNTIITVHGRGPQTTKEKRVMTEQFFKDSADILIFNIHVK